MTAVGDRPIGFGRVQRKEDPRFVRGKGRYIDDIVLPGMLHGAILRSPLAHAKLVSIDTTDGDTAASTAWMSNVPWPTEGVGAVDPEPAAVVAGEAGFTGTLFDCASGAGVVATT